MNAERTIPTKDDSPMLAEGPGSKPAEPSARRTSRIISVSGGDNEGFVERLWTSSLHRLMTRGRDPHTGLGSLEHALAAVAGATSAQAGALFIHEPNVGDFVFALLYPVDIIQRQDWKQISARCGVAAWVAEHAITANVTDPVGDQRFDADFDQPFHFEVRNTLAAPISHLGQIVGVIQLFNKEGQQAFDARDRVKLELSCHFAAPALADITTA